MKRCPQCNRVEADNALTFCRVDGIPLIRDSSSITGDVGTAKFGSGAVSSETQTNLLPHRTDAHVNSPTAPTTVLPAAQIPDTTRELSKPKRRGIVIGIISVAILLAVIAGFFFSRKSNATIQSIAVMPFVNTSGNQDVEYLADGITETLISKLSQLPNMNVKARSSVFHYKGKETDAKTIGSELNVQAVLNGRVLQRGDELTLTVELVDTHSENVIWSEQYSRRQADLINLQSEIARDVVSKLRSKLSGAEEQKLAKAYTTDPEAYQLYLKGIFYRSKRSPDDLRKGLDYFQQAVARDPNYALAYVGIANSNSLFAVFGLIPTSEGYPRAKAAAQKAMEIDNTLSEAHATLADVAANYDWDWELAEREYKRALELDPNDAGAHASYGLHYLIPMRRFDEAVQELRRALELEPLSLSINASFGAALTSARRYDEAITQLRKTVELDPNFVLTRWRLTFAYSCAGRHAEAIAEPKKGLEISNAPWSKSNLAGAYARAGDREGALKMIEELKQVKPPNNTAFMIGRAYAELGDKEQAFEWLNKAYANKDWMLPKIHVEPWIDGKLWKENISPDPRMADLVRRMGLTP
jgi:TolB-like protein/Tfp pilus assembly protein PilF